MQPGLRNSAAQDWLVRRLRCLRPSDFGDGLRFIACSPELEFPEAFSGAWFYYSGPNSLTLHVTAERLAATNAFFIFSSPFVADQVRATADVVALVVAFGPDAPPVFWIPHTVAPEVRPSAYRIQPPNEGGGEVFRIMELGLDGFLVDEPEGMRLALQVRKEALKPMHMAEVMNSIIAARRTRAARGINLKRQIHCFLWDYLCVRIAPCIPPCDVSLAPNLPTEIAGARVGRQLGKGIFGLVKPGGSGGAEFDEVVKVIDKKTMCRVQDIKRLKRMTDVMLTVSCERWRHPNLMQLIDIHHSKTHLTYRQEFCGASSLHDRLCEETSAELSLRKLCSAIKQVFMAVTYLHVGPGICHRDLKPENFLLTETQASLFLKLTEFDLSVVLGKHSLCRNPCGTIPFVAPEVFTSQKYDGRAADMWSLGVVLLEILGGLRVVERALDLKLPETLMARRLTKRFQSTRTVDRILDHAREEARELLDDSRELAHGLLTVDVLFRWKAREAMGVAVGTTDRVMRQLSGQGWRP